MKVMPSTSPPAKFVPNHDEKMPPLAEVGSPLSLKMMPGTYGVVPPTFAVIVGTGSARIDACVIEEGAKLPAMLNETVGVVVPMPKKPPDAAPAIVGVLDPRLMVPAVPAMNELFSISPLLDA